MKEQQLILKDKIVKIVIKEGDNYKIEDILRILTDLEVDDSLDEK